MKPLARTIVPGLVSLILAPGTASAYYDDVHYALTYYIARQTGYTPQQSFRIASACSSVDWDEHTEPVQAHGQAVLLADRGEGLIDFTEFGVRVAAKFLPKLAIGMKLDRLDGFLVKELTIKKYREAVTRARFRFHAFRDELAHEDPIGDGPAAGPDAGPAQHDINVLLDVDGPLFAAAVRNRNIGAYLHAFEDLEPHRGYGTTWGHNPFPPDSFQVHVDRGLIVGSTTDWVSYRQGDVDSLCQHVNKRLILFMQRASPHQTWRDHAPHVLEYSAVVSRLARLAENRKPEPMTRDIQRQIFIRNYALAKGIDLNRIDGSLVDFRELAVVAHDLGIGIPVDDIRKHMEGPRIDPAVDVVNAALEAAGMSDRLPYHHYPYDLDEDGEPAEEQLDDWVLVGSMVLRTRGARPVTATLKTVVRDAAGKEREVPVFGFEPVVMRPGVPHEWPDLPIGDVIVELARDNGTVLRQEYTLTRRVNEFPPIFVGDLSELARPEAPVTLSRTVPVVFLVVRGGTPLPVPGAQVKVEDSERQVVGTATTGGDGRTRRFDLPVYFSGQAHARYRVTITAPGYRVESRSLPGWWHWDQARNDYHTTEQTLSYSLYPGP